MERTEGNLAVKVNEKFTIDQWRTWPEGERWELIGGTAYAMSAAPTVKHQDYSMNLGYKIYKFLEDKPCKAYTAPLDVFLNDESVEYPDVVVEPDLVVVCDQAKIRDDGIYGAPDFIAEILSPSTAFKDLTEKRQLYERVGVREYWVINPDNGSVWVYVLHEGRYGKVAEYLKDDLVPSAALAGFSWQGR